jgi:branched-subunit amino acid aminotransferase/4-amino-4-deoxychorismate lyase
MPHEDAKIHVLSAAVKCGLGVFEGRYERILERDFQPRRAAAAPIRRAE